MNTNEIKDLQDRVRKCNSTIERRTGEIQSLEDQRNSLMKELQGLGFKTIEEAEKFQEDYLKKAEIFATEIETLELEISEILEGSDE
jgi:hypothetical protein